MKQQEFILEQIETGQKHIFKSSLDIHKLNNVILHSYTVYRRNPKKYKYKPYFDILKNNKYKLYKKKAMERYLEEKQLKK